MTNHTPVETPFFSLNPYRQSGELNVIIDTPKGSRNKFKYDPELGLFKLAHVLPVGAQFPFNFGYLPATQAGDGDPLDVLVLLDEPAFTGCLVPARLIGLLEAQQTFEGKTTRNDRLIAVAVDSPNHQSIQTLDQVNAHLLDQLEHFFISYNAIKGKQFVPLGRSGPARAQQMVEEGIRIFADKK
ncbi:MAG: inorganic diphosphatase [Chloroflexi bacterium]|nr:inorganic diphosphatase [Chloroflexota bacterium]